MSVFSRTAAIGLEIDTGVIRAVELRGHSRHPVLGRFGQVEIPEDAVEGGVISDATVIANALRELWAKVSFRSRDVVLGIATSGMLMRPITMPKVPEERLSQAIQMQAGDYFPIAISQLVLDYAVLGEREGESGLVLDVFLVAARKEELGNSMEALEGGGLSTDIIDIAPFAVMRHLSEEEQETVVLVDIANGVSSLVVVQGQIPRFSRILSVGVLSYAEMLDCPLDAVFSDGNRQGESPQGKTPMEACEIWCSRLASEINTSINYYLAMNNAAGVDQVKLSGRGSRVGGLMEKMEDELGLPVTLIDPEDRVANSRELGQDAPDYAVSIGLALRGLKEV